MASTAILIPARYNSSRLPGKPTVEQLEQLRWLKNGWQIKVASVQYKGTEINTPEDEEQWHRIHSQ